MTRRESNSEFFWAVPLGAAVLLGSAYLATASQGMLWLDAPRFVAAIVTLGVGNPPEPLYMILAHPFIFLPFGSVVFRIQILSAIFGTVTLFALYRLVEKILKQVGKSAKDKADFSESRILLAGLFALFSLGFSYEFWTQSQNVENFVLVALLDTLVLVLIVVPRRRFLKSLLLIACLLGLASGTNPIAASVVPSVLFVVWEKRRWLTTKNWLAIGAVGLGSLIFVFSYVLMTASANPFLNWKRPLNLEPLWSLARGADLNFNMPERGLVNGFTGSWNIFVLSSGNYFKMAWLNFTPVMLPFVILGGYFLFRRSRRTFWILLLTAGTNFLFSGVYLSGNQEAWYLVSDVILAACAGVGFFWLVNLLSQEAWKRARMQVGDLVTGVFFILLFLTLVFRWSTLDRQPWRITQDYVQNLYRSIKGPALVFGTYDLFDANTYYAYALYGAKTKAIPLGADYIYDMEWYKKNIALNTDLKFPSMILKHDGPDEYSIYMNELFALNLPKYRIYFTIPALRNNFFPIANYGPSLRVDETKYKLVPEGMVQELVPKDSQEVPQPGQYDYQFSTPGFPQNLPVIYDRTYSIELTHMLHEYAQSYQFLADYALTNSKPEIALSYYQRAISFDPENTEVLGRLGNFYGTYGDPQEAMPYFEKGLQLDPNNVTFHFNLALLKERTGDDKGAAAELAKVIQLGQDPSQLTSQDAALVAKAKEILNPPSPTPKPSSK